MKIMKTRSTYLALIMALVMIASVAAAEPTEPGTPSEPAEAIDPLDVPLSAGHADMPDDPPDPDLPAASPADAEPEPSDQALASHIAVSLSRDVVFPGSFFEAWAVISPEHADQRVKWSSSSAAIAVDESGAAQVAEVLSVPEDGLYVDIWAHATDGSLAMNCATVRVMPRASSLSFLSDQMTVDAGAAESSARITLAVAPASLYGVTPIEWTTSDASIARVHPDGMNGEVGVVTWTGQEGRVTLTASASDGSGLCAEMALIVAD